MKISKKGQYALISVVDLALHGADNQQSIADVATRENIDPRYLGQIFFALKNAGIISSVRGKNGGYFLSKAPLEITAGEVVRALEGDLAPTVCSSEASGSVDCEAYGECHTRSLWQTLAHEINDTLDSFTIAQLADVYIKES
ncbi:MAG: RrF2 family transcriptional regulator [Clostridia bacterium]|jgi:Rrf2 family transcriptional regulator, cysteine metabolism repressor|nr:RrF2 family transcriptional regulator [Clostridia bacterium]